MREGIIIIAEHFEGKLNSVTFELLGFAAELQKIHMGEITAVVVGDEIETLAKEMAEKAGIYAVALKIPGLTWYNGESYKSALAQVLSELEPAYVCIGHTTQGWDFAPGLAVRLGAACVTGVERVWKREGRIGFTRAVYGGKILAEVLPVTETTVLTVQPGIFKSPSFGHVSTAEVDMRVMPDVTLPSQTTAVKTDSREEAGLSEAEVIVSAGRGIRKKENLNLIHALAGMFPKSAVAGSRPVCDMRWLEYKQQVGLTGASVSPKLYIACGISGAAQHLAGMRSSEFIVAINTDPNAAIFNVADVCVQEDLTTFIPLLIDAYGKGKEKE